MFWSRNTEERVVRETQEEASSDLPIFSGTLYLTDCTCAVYRHGRAVFDDRWIHVCLGCGATRRGTGT